MTKQALNDLQKARRIRVFVASPGDTNVERESLPGIVNELNRTLRALLPSLRHYIELVRWESHAFPAMGRPQGLINDQIGDYDIFIGLLWKRFGTPTGKAESGTEEEFGIALDNWHKHGRPHILFYFNLQEFGLPKILAEVEQMSKVVSFRERLESSGLVWEYESADAFSSVVRPHLTEVVGRLLNSTPSSATVTEAIVSSDDRQHQESGLPPIGMRISITEIGPNDAFDATTRPLIIGRRGVAVELRKNNDWYSGKVRLDEPVHGTETLILFEFRYELARDA